MLGPTRVTSLRNFAKVTPNMPTPFIAAHDPCKRTSAAVQSPKAVPVRPRNAGDVCPITQEPLDTLQAVCVAEDAYAYDRAALTLWLMRSELSPMTRMAMPRTSFELLGMSGLAQQRLAVLKSYLLEGNATRAMLLVAGPFVGATFGLASLVAIRAEAGVHNSVAMGLFALSLGAAAGLGAGAACIVLLNARADAHLQHRSRAAGASERMQVAHFV